MTIAREYLDLFQVTCQFHNWIRDASGATVSDEVCGAPVVAVYITDDDRHQGVFACQCHAEASEREWDGPVFWQSIAKEPVDVADSKSDTQG